MATLRDVAKLSGVSTATVSNVLNARNDRVSPETREKVLAAVRKLKYRPIALEKDQKAIRTQNLGVMVTDITKNPLLLHGYFRNTLDGIMEAAMFAGWSVTIFAEKTWDDLGLAIRRSYDGRCDGLIIIAPTKDSETVKTLQERGVTLVLVGTTANLPGISSVDIDNDSCAAQIANHFLGLGHRRFAFVGTDSITMSANERERTFRRVLVDAGIPPANYSVHWLKLEKKTPDDLIAEFQAMGPKRPTAVFGWHDEAAMGVLKAAQRAGLRVPEDISIVGIDDSPEAGQCSPGLSSIPQPLHLIGKRAASLIIERVADGHAPDEIVRFTSELIVRGSTGPSPDKS